MSLRNSYGNNNQDKVSENLDLLWMCKDYWDGLDYVRRQRRRNRDFRNGRQWTPKEYAAIMRNGTIPIIQNYISLMVRNLMGQFIIGKGSPVAIARKEESSDEGKMMSLAIEHVMEVNDDGIKDRDMLEDLMLGGVACSRIGYGYISSRDMDDLKTTNINLNRLFFNTDIDESSIANLDVIGLVCDDSMNGMIVNFADTKDDENFLKEIYGQSKNDKKYYQNRYSAYINQNTKKLDNLDFLQVEDDRKCRYYEIWSRERRMIIRYHDTSNGQYGVSFLSVKEIEGMNQRRILQALEMGLSEEDAKLICYRQQYEFVWTYKYVTPQGYILKEGDSPYIHQSHPFVLSFYNIIDGEIHPILSDVVDQQRYINRLIMQMDFMIGKAAKGVLLIPEELLANGYTKEEVAEIWSSFDGVLFIKNKPGAVQPQQIYSNNTSPAIQSMFQTQLEMMQQILGVNSAIQGQKAQSNTPASRYAQETANAQLNSKDLFERFSKWRLAKYTKVLKLIKQYYDEDKYLSVAGAENIAFNPDVKDIDYDLTISESNSNSNYALTEADQLFQMAAQGLIPIEDYLRVSPAGYAKKLLSFIQERQQQMISQQQAAQGQLPPAQMTDEQAQLLAEQIQEQGADEMQEDIPEPQDQQGQIRDDIPYLRNRGNSSLDSDDILRQILG